MPHVIVKLYAGKSEQQKSNLAAQITKPLWPALTVQKNPYQSAYKISRQVIGSRKSISRTLLVTRKYFTRNPATIRFR